MEETYKLNLRYIHGTLRIYHGPTIPEKYTNYKPEGENLYTKPQEGMHNDANLAFASRPKDGAAYIKRLWIEN